MKTGLWSLALVALISITTACSSKGESAARAASAEPAEELSPAQLFQRKCASCHGATGVGDGQLATAFPSVSDLTSAAVQSRYSDEELSTVITRGIRRMPPVRGLSEGEISALIGHVRSLAAQ